MAALPPKPQRGPVREGARLVACRAGAKEEWKRSRDGPWLCFLREGSRLRCWRQPCLGHTQPAGSRIRLIKSLAAQIGGQVEQESSEQGTTTTLLFPVHHLSLRV
jgi:hypothetical protein